MSEQIFCKTMGSEQQMKKKRVFCSSSIKISQQMGGGRVQLPNWWRLRKLVARSAMRCAKLVIPETGFVGEEKFVFHLTGGGGVCVASIYLPRMFSLYAPGAGVTEKIG